MALEIRSLITFRWSLFKLGVFALIFNKYLIGGNIQTRSRDNIFTVLNGIQSFISPRIFKSLVLLRPHSCFQLHICDSSLFAQTKMNA